VTTVCYEGTQALKGGVWGGGGSTDAAKLEPAQKKGFQKDLVISPHAGCSQAEKYSNSNVMVI